MQAMRYNPGRSPFPRRDSTTREIDLATAISEIKQAPEEAEDGKSTFPVIAGVGTSYAIRTSSLRGRARGQAGMKST